MDIFYSLMKSHVLIICMCIDVLYIFNRLQLSRFILIYDAHLKSATLIISHRPESVQASDCISFLTVVYISLIQSE